MTCMQIYRVAQQDPGTVAEGVASGRPELDMSGFSNESLAKMLESGVKEVSARVTIVAF